MSFDGDFDGAVKRVLSQYPNLSDDKLDVKVHFPYVRAALLPVATNYHGIGAFLGLLPSKLRKFKGKSDLCLTEVLAEWFLNCGPVTWKRVVILIADPSAGDNPGYAGNVAEEYQNGIKPIPEAVGVDDKKIGSSAYGSIRKMLIDGGLANKWMEIGLYLGIPYKDLQGLDGDNQEKMDEVIEKWLSGKGDTEVFGVPSWMKLVEAIGSPAGGSNRHHASEVAKNHQGSGKAEPMPPPGGKAEKQPDAARDIPLKATPRAIASHDVEVATDGPSDRTIRRYKINSSGKHGYCLIINNEKFRRGAKLGNRGGSSKDVDRLRDVFSLLGYNVRLKQDLTAVEIDETIQQYTEDIPHKDNDSFVCCILSHGKEGMVAGTDGEYIKIREISRRLTACKELERKPKLFFIQACQGKTAPPMLKSDAEEDEDQESAIPRDSDCFFGYGTTPETVSLRDESKGTWYIQELCNVLENQHHRYDLVTMITIVHNQVATHPDYQYAVTGKSSKVLYYYRQQPQMVSTLRHRMYFK